MIKFLRDLPEIILLLLIFAIPAIVLAVPILLMQRGIYRSSGTRGLAAITGLTIIVALFALAFAWIPTMPCWGGGCDTTHTGPYFLPMLLIPIAAWFAIFVIFNHVYCLKKISRPLNH